MSGRRGIGQSSPSGKFAKNRGTPPSSYKPCFFNINLPKELRPLPCQGKNFFFWVKKSCGWVVTHRIMKISSRDAHPFLKKISDTIFFLLLFWLFLSEILSPRSRLSRTTSDLATKSGKSQTKICVFSAFFRRKFWHDFVTQFSTFANIKGSLWTNLTTPDRLRCRTKTDGEYFSRFLAN